MSGTHSNAVIIEKTANIIGVVFTEILCAVFMIWDDFFVSIYTTSSAVAAFAISRMLGGGTELLLGDLIERQFLGGAYNPQLGAAISLVMMIIVVICMLVMNRFGEGEEQAVMM